MSITREERVERYRTAALSARELYESDSLSETLNKIAAAYLKQEDIGDFIDLIGDVILELELPSNVYSRLTTRFGLTPERAAEVISRLNLDIASPLIHFEIDNTSESSNDRIRPDDFKPLQKAVSPEIPPTPAVRVMPHTPQEAAASQARSGTELPNSLLKNLHASLAHSAPEEIPDDTPSPAPSYNTFLGKTPPTK